jgi:hypothetical protein
MSIIWEHDLMQMMAADVPATLPEVPSLDKLRYLQLPEVPSLDKLRYLQLPEVPSLDKLR